MHSRILLLGVLIPVALLTLTLGVPARSAAASDTGTISGRVMRDLDQDGDATDVNEPALSGWTVTLEGPYGDESGLRKTTTDVDGRYVFDGVLPGEYDVWLPCDGQPSVWGYNPVEFIGYSVTMEAGGREEELNFPVIPIPAVPNPPRTGSITGKVVLDRNRDGVVRESDPGMAGWHVTAGRTEPTGSCAEDESLETDVDAGGRFRFDHLPAGHYSVAPNSDNAPLSRWAITSPLVAQEEDGHAPLRLADLEVTEDETAQITVGVASLEGTASISGSVYADLNRNGVRDSDEPVAITGCWMFLGFRVGDGYVGVSPLLSNCEPDGIYRFVGLAPGDYIVAALYQFSPAVSPPAEYYEVSFHAVSISEGEQRTGIDFGYEAVPEPEEPTPTPSPDSSLPTVAPTQAADAGTPVPPGGVASPASSGVSAPSTGSGGTASTDRTPWTAAAIGLAVIGSAGYTLSRLRRRA